MRRDRLPRGWTLLLLGLLTLSPGAEVAAQIQEHAFDYLDAPVARVGAPFSPVPFSPALEAHYVPNADKIVQEVRKLLGA